MADNYLARNDRSRERATRNKEPWTPEDEAYLLGHWCADHECQEQASAHLGRTIAACYQRWSALVGEHGAVKRPRTVEVTFEVCTGCWTVLPATGVCDQCGEG